MNLFVKLDGQKVIFAAKVKDSLRYNHLKNTCFNLRECLRKISELSYNLSRKFHYVMKGNFSHSHVTFDKLQVMKLLNNAITETHQKTNKRWRQQRYS